MLHGEVSGAVSITYSRCSLVLHGEVSGAVSITYPPAVHGVAASALHSSRLSLLSWDGISVRFGPLFLPEDSVMAVVAEGTRTLLRGEGNAQTSVR